MTGTRGGATGIHGMALGRRYWSGAVQTARHVGGSQALIAIADFAIPCRPVGDIRLII